MQTAKIVAGDAFLIIMDDRLIEMDYGPYEGMDLQNPAPEVVEFFRDFVHHPAPEGMEQLRDVVARLGSFLEEIREEADGTITLTQCCAVAGLGGKDHRSGDYEYYIHEKITENDPKGVGPFIWASLIYERI